MDSPTCDTPLSESNLNTTTTNNSLITRLIKNDHSNTQLLVSEGKEMEHGSQVSDQLVESSSPVTAQPNSVNTYSAKPNEADALNNGILNQTGITNTASIVTNINTTTDTTGNKKPTPKRAMILSGRPAPPLPPRPVFPADLKNYQLQSGTAETSSHMQAYLSRVRSDFEQQTEHFEVLKEIILEDTHHMTAVVDELDAMDEDPFTLDSFENLMRMHARKGKDFIIARVTTHDPNDGEKHYHSYYGAHQINKVLFRTQPDEGLLHRMKARNPLNNMLVVGDVHYYLISAADVNAVRPLPTVVRSSSASISSHSSRMSRCSKLAAQAIASQSASARSSPILGSDMSLFSRSSDLESPVSIISPLMALSILNADQEDPIHLGGSDCDGGSSSSTTPASATAEHDVIEPHKPRRRGSQGSTSSTTLTATFPQGTATFHHQPGRPSRLREAIETEEPCDTPASTLTTAGAGSFAEDAFSPTTPPAHHAHPSSSQASPSSAAGQSPLFQSLMGGRVRNRSSTVSSVSSDESSTSTMSARSHASKCSTATNDSNSNATSSSNECYSPSVLGSPINNSNLDNTQDKDKKPNSKGSGDDSVIYKFRYLASDDDFLLRSTVRQTFKINALETWDAILFTISDNALREYSSQGGEQVLQPLGGHGDHQPFPSPPSSLPSEASEPVPFQQPDQQVTSSLPTPTTAAAAVAAQYSAAHNQNQNQSVTSLPPLIVPRPQDISPSSRPITELHHHHSNSTSAPNNNITSFDTEDSATTPSSPLDGREGRSEGGGLYSADVNGVPRTFNNHSFSHTPRRQSRGGQEIQQLEGEGGAEGLSRSMSHNFHSRRVGLFRSLPALPLGASSTAVDQEGGLAGGDGEVSELNCGASRTTGSHKKFRHVLSKIFSRK
ncbi:hypothetical protein EC957_007395 [Mortierella hygrophila]|uniref:Uncharacterized protein n=1 Tax=Mortierella hygrophila TaxID=979708 RepID=A0A9P6EY31_9FUNG|nr:hypothetical protein EC957_007395 [Mortierella hygrophila]